MGTCYFGGCVTRRSAHKFIENSDRKSQNQFKNGKEATTQARCPSIEFECDCE